VSEDTSPGSAPAIPPGHPSGAPRTRSDRPDGLTKLLRVFSFASMALTVPQVWAVWTGPSPAGVSLVSWLAYLFGAGLWFVYGMRRRDPTIFLACIGWILLDAAVVAGVLVRR
jgi:uncharacterized protein with PQ loop repeat